MATATPTGFSSALSGLPDQVLLAHTRSLVLHEQALQLAVLDHLREIHAGHLHLRLGFSSLFDYAVRELGYSEGAAWRRIKAMRLCSETAGSRERLQDGSLSLSAAAQLQNTFDLLQRTATAAAECGSPPAAPELLPGGTGTAPEAGAAGIGAAAPARAVPPLDAAQRQELVAQASGKSTREVKQLLAGVAPELARPADRMRALGEGRWELKVVIDAACQCGIEQLRALLSHVDPHLTLGQLVERLVQDGLQRYDPGRPPRGRGGGRRRQARARRRSRRRSKGRQTGRLRRRSGARKSSPQCRRRSARSPVAAPRRRQRCPQRNPRAGLAAPAPRRWQRCPRRRRGARLSGAAPRCVPSQRWRRPAPLLRRRSWWQIVGPAPPYRRRRQTGACRPRRQRRIVVAAAPRQRSGQGRQRGQERSSMAVRARSRRQPTPPEAARSRPTGRVDPGMAPRRRLLQLRRSAQWAALRLPLSAGA